MDLEEKCWSHLCQLVIRYSCNESISDSQQAQKHLYNIYTASAQRLRRWFNIV